VDRQQGDRPGIFASVYRVVSFAGRLNMTIRKACRTGWGGFRISIVFCGLAVLLSGCVSGNLTKARNDYYSGKPDQAIEVLADPDDVSSRDRLLYFMDRGLILHHLGMYEESTHSLLSAVGLMEEQDRISIGQQVTSLVTTEWATDYKGEYAERLLVHTYLIMNYLIMGLYDDALVESKQALKIYDRYPEACREDYFTRTLIAQCFEMSGDFNGAYIEYKKLVQAMPDPSPVAPKLYAIGKQLGFDDEIESYSQYAPDAQAEAVGGQNTSELIVFVSQGLSPIKIPQNIVLPPSIRFSFSTYSDRSHYYNPPEIRMSSEAGKVRMVTTDVGQVLKDSLQERLTQIIVKETARVAAKEAIAQSVKDDDAEILVRAVLFLLEQPDTRCWETLPGYLTMIRIPVAAGQHQFSINTYDGPGGCVELKDVNINPVQKYYFYSIRNGVVSSEVNATIPN
jgi:uncharacterized protein